MPESMSSEGTLGYSEAVAEANRRIEQVLALPDDLRAKGIELLRKELLRAWKLIILKPGSKDDPRYDSRWPTLVCSEGELRIKKFVEGRI